MYNSVRLNNRAHFFFTIIAPQTCSCNNNSFKLLCKLRTIYYLLFYLIGSIHTCKI